MNSIGVLISSILFISVANVIPHIQVFKPDVTASHFHIKTIFYKILYAMIAVVVGVVGLSFLSRHLASSQTGQTGSDDSIDQVIEISLFIALILAFALHIFFILTDTKSATFAGDSLNSYLWKTIMISTVFSLVSLFTIIRGHTDDSDTYVIVTQVITGLMFVFVATQLLAIFTNRLCDAEAGSKSVHDAIVNQPSSNESYSLRGSWQTSTYLAIVLATCSFASNLWNGTGRFKPLFL